MSLKITSYTIDDNNVMHTYIGDLKHVTVNDVTSDEQAERLCNELDAEREENEKGIDF